VPALEFLAIAGNGHEGVVRTEVTEDVVSRGEVEVAASIGISGVKVGAVGELRGSERGLVEHEAPGADAGDFLILGHVVGDLAGVGLGGGTASKEESGENEN